MLQKIKNIFWHLPKSIFFNFFYFFPSRKLVLIGVTGTDGKTTTSTLIHHLLEQSGYKVALISTITSPGLHTTSPDPKYLQKYFYDLGKQGYTHVVCEVTSHALDQYRYWGCQFAVSVLTNISHEHLDYHKTINNYIKSKSRLFLQSQISVLNRDDYSYSILKKLLPQKPKTYSAKFKSDYTAKNIKTTLQKLSFNFNGNTLTTDSPYHYQVYNILAALSVISELNINIKKVIPLLKHFPETKGRREEVNNSFKFRTIIDFAHTPAALDATLSSLKKVTPNRLIVIFGATGGRDKTKRPIMGQVVQNQADIAILTSDDTRNEKIKDINQQIISGFDLSNAHENKPNSFPKEKIFNYYQIENRQDAFNQAIKIAQPGDTIIACGKGHETSILLGNTEYPWSESEAFRTAFRLRKST